MLAGEARDLVASAQTRAEQAEQRARGQLEEAIAELEREMVADRERQLEAVTDGLDGELRLLHAVPHPGATGGSELRQAVIRARRNLEEREREKHARLGWLMRARQ